MSDSGLDKELLLDISNEISKPFECKQLAIRLRIGDDTFEDLKKTTDDPTELAFELLKKWSGMEGNDGCKLYDILNKKPFEDWAANYRERLLPTGHSPVTTGASKQGSSPVLTPAASQPSQTISPDAMTTVAGVIPSLEACQSLAAKLKFSHVELLAINKFDGMTASRILSKWYAREPEKATGQALYDALCAIGLRVIAKEYKDLLSAHDPSCSAELSQSQSGQGEASSSSHLATAAGNSAQPQQHHDLRSASHPVKVSRGKNIKQRTPLFGKISRSISEIQDVRDLADILLRDVVPISGSDWVMSKQAPGGVLSPMLAVREVLDHWYNHSPETPCGGQLYDALREVVPRVADKFKYELVED